jgi:hypothetical protein
MPRKSHTVEQIYSKLREAEGLLGQGQTVGDICWSFAISEQTYTVVTPQTGQSREGER